MSELWHAQGSEGQELCSLGSREEQGRPVTLSRSGLCRDEEVGVFIRAPTGLLWTGFVTQRHSQAIPTLVLSKVVLFGDKISTVQFRWDLCGVGPSASNG